MGSQFCLLLDYDCFFTLVEKKTREIFLSTFCDWTKKSRQNVIQFQ